MSKWYKEMSVKIQSSKQLSNIKALDKLIWKCSSQKHYSHKSLLRNKLYNQLQIGKREWAPLVAQTVKNPLAKKKNKKIKKKKRIHWQCGRPGFNPWVGKNAWRWARHPSPLLFPRESPWTEEPGGLQSTGSKRVGHD